MNPTGQEMEHVAEIFKVPHFRQLIGQKQQLKGLPVADPFLVARGAGSAEAIAHRFSRFLVGSEDPDRRRVNQ
jgi:hypothetical protein